MSMLIVVTAVLARVPVVVNALVGAQIMIIIRDYSATIISTMGMLVGRQVHTLIRVIRA